MDEVPKEVKPDICPACGALIGVWTPTHACPGFVTIRPADDRAVEG